MLRKSALFIVLAIIAVGCSNGEGESTAYESQVPAEARAGGKRDSSAFLDLKDAPMPSPNGISVAGYSQTRRPSQPAENRAVVRGATLEVRVEKLDDAEKKVNEAIKQSGGHEVTLSSTNLAGPDATISINAKVPVEKLDDVIASIETLGTRLGKTISMQDVTDNLMTFDTQISALRSEEARVQRAGKDKPVHDGYAYQLQAIRDQMAQIQAQRLAQAKAAAFSNLQLTLRQGAVPGASDPNWLAQAYGQSSSSAFVALRVAATGLLWLVFMSPFYMPFVAGAWLYHRMQKRKLAATPPRVATPTAPPSMQQV